MNSRALLLTTLVLLLLISRSTLAATVEEAKVSMERKDFQTAHQQLLEAIADGNSEAMYLMATLYDGGALSDGATEALKYYEMAGNAGHVYAQHQCGTLYLSGPLEIIDEAKARSWFRKAAENGNGYSALVLAQLYETARGGDEDLDQAVQMYLIAAEQDFPGAQFVLAQRYLAGNFLEKDPLQALYWFERAAKSGHTEAGMAIAQIYLVGDEGIPVDYKRASFWLVPVAQGGNPRARYLLGTLYAEGKGVAKDSAKAADLFNLAAIGGQADAQYEIGKLQTEAGDKVEALAWWLLAAETGHDQANTGRVTLESQLTAAEQQRAFTRASEIRKANGL